MIWDFTENKMKFIKQIDINMVIWLLKFSHLQLFKINQKFGLLD